MKPWKLMLLAAGVAGVIGLFLPLVSVTHTFGLPGKLAKSLTVGFNAFDLSFRYDKVRHKIEDPLVQLAGRRVIGKSDMEDARLVVDASRGAALAFAPAGLLLVFGAIGVLRKRVGRLIGAGALVFGLASISGWIGLRFVIDYALEDARLSRTTVELGVGAHVLLVIGALGVIAGLGALVQPDRGS